MVYITIKNLKIFKKTTIDEFVNTMKTKLDIEKIYQSIQED